MSRATSTSVCCQRCGESFRVPELKAAEQSEVAELARAGQIAESIRLLRQITGIEVRDANLIELHITRTPGVCNRCEEQLSATGQIECPKCRAINLNW